MKSNPCWILAVGLCGAVAQCGSLYLCAGAFSLHCWRALFSALADLLALRNLPLATWQGARLRSACVLQRVSFIFVVSRVASRKMTERKMHEIKNVQTANSSSPFSSALHDAVFRLCRGRNNLIKKCENTVKKKKHEKMTKKQTRENTVWT